MMPRLILINFLLLRSTFGESLAWIRSSNVLGDFNFYDELGRTRIFHGANRVQESPPWYRPEMASSDAVAIHMRRLGLTIMRLGFMWSGYNPSPGVFNQTYIDMTKTIVHRLERHGVYTLLNVQMDGLSSKFCAYDGIPLWVIDKASAPTHPFPWPLEGNASCSSQPNWQTKGDGADIMTEASVSAYQDIFDNRNGMLDDFVSFWEHAAEQFSDMPGIIGYELINEPMAGNWYKDPTLFLPGVAGKKNLQKMYDALAVAIRKHDDRHIVFYEPVTWGMIFSGKLSGSGFQHVPGGDAYRNRSAYSFHYYCHCFVPTYNKTRILAKVVCDKGIAPLIYKAVQEDVSRLGGAAMQTEGMQCGDGEIECINNRNALDERLFSWIDWNFDDSPNVVDNAPDVGEVSADWARTYAYAVAGTPINMTFDPQTKDFHFCFKIELAIQAPTEIFASTHYNYLNGFTVTASSNVNATVNGDLVFVTPIASNEVDGSEACVHIKRCSHTVVMV